MEKTIEYLATVLTPELQTCQLPLQQDEIFQYLQVSSYIVNRKLSLTIYDLTGAEDREQSYQFLFEDASLHQLFERQVPDTAHEVVETSGHNVQHSSEPTFKCLSTGPSVDSIITEFIKGIPFGQFITRHAVFRIPGNYEINELYERFKLFTSSRRSGFPSIIVASHEYENESRPRHIHVVHLCSTIQDGSCRCFNTGRRLYFFKSEFGDFEFNRRRDFNQEYISNAIRYLGTGFGRKLLFATYPNGGFRLYNSSQDNEENREPVPSKICHNFSCFSNNSTECNESTDATDSTSSTATENATSKPRPAEEIQTLLKNYWCNDLPQLLLHASTATRNAVTFNSRFEREIWPKLYRDFVLGTLRPWLYADFKDYLCNCPTATFGAESNVLHYQSLENSIETLACILQYQEGINVFQFFTNVESWFNYYGTLSGGFKQNTLWFHGPPDCGKTTFCNVLCDIAMAVGKPESVYKGQTFPWGDCINQRLVFFDEAEWTVEHNQNMKKITAGEDFYTNVKYERLQQFKRTPILMATNSDPFKWDRHIFTPRVLEYRWRPLPTWIKLRMRLGRLHPLCFFHLYDLVIGNNAYTLEVYNTNRNVYDPL